MAKKRNLYKSLGLTGISEATFNKAIEAAGRAVRKKFLVDISETEKGSYIQSGPLSFFVRADGRFAYLKKPGVEPDPKQKIPHFRLFINAKPFEHPVMEFCKDIFVEKLKEYAIDDAEQQSAIGSCPNRTSKEQGKDLAKLKHIGKMLMKLAPPPGKSFNDLMRIILHHVWKKFDKETLDITIRTIGYGATTFELSLIGENIDEVRGIYASTPGVIPVWIARKYRQNSPIETQTGMLQEHTEFVDWEAHNGPKREENFTYQSQSVIADAKAELASMKATEKRVWKFICKLSPRWSRTITTRGHFETRAGLYKVLAEVAELPRYTVLRDFVSNAWSFTDRAYGQQQVPHDTKIAFLRAAFKASRGKPAKTFWQREAQLVWDWIQREHVTLDANQQRASWDWFMRMQEDWHRDYEERQRIQRERMDADAKAREAARKHYWDSLVPQFERNGYVVTPLTTTEMLKKEGSEMHHCVGSYNADCEDGKSRIFSIRKGSMDTPPESWERESTLELRCHDMSWTMGQNRGISNGKQEDGTYKEIPDEVRKLGEHVLYRYKEAYAKWLKEIVEEERAKKEAADNQPKLEGEVIEQPAEPEPNRELVLHGQPADVF